MFGLLSIYISFFLNNNNSTALVDKCTEYTTSNTHTFENVFVAYADFLVTRDREGSSIMSPYVS